MNEYRPRIAFPGGRHVPRNTTKHENHLFAGKARPLGAPTDYFRDNMRSRFSSSPACRHTKDSACRSSVIGHNLSVSSADRARRARLVRPIRGIGMIRQDEFRGPVEAPEEGRGTARSRDPAHRALARAAKIIKRRRLAPATWISPHAPLERTGSSRSLPAPDSATAIRNLREKPSHPDDIVRYDYFCRSDFPQDRNMAHRPLRLWIHRRDRLSCHPRHIILPVIFRLTSRVIHKQRICMDVFEALYAIDSF
jgi:hypothetical protein